MQQPSMKLKRMHLLQAQVQVGLRTAICICSCLTQCEFAEIETGECPSDR